jgi:hypothetical protein
MHRVSAVYFVCLAWYLICVLRHSSVPERTVCTLHLANLTLRVAGRKRCQRKMFDVPHPMMHSRQEFPFRFLLSGRSQSAIRGGFVVPG